MNISFVLLVGTEDLYINSFYIEQKFSFQNQSTKITVMIQQNKKHLDVM